MSKRLSCIIVTIIVIFIGLCLAGIATAWFFLRHEDPPGVGAKAEKGYQVCAPIISAIDDYKIRNGVYPEKLTDLNPPQPADPTALAEFGIVYRQTGLSYQLRFQYTGPGMNTCVFTPEKKWSCSGFY